MSVAGAAAPVADGFPAATRSLCEAQPPSTGPTSASAAKRDMNPLRFRRMLPPPDGTRSPVPFEFLEPISFVVMDIPSVTTSSGVRAP